MKLLIIFICSVSIISAAKLNGGQAEKIRQISRKCLEESGVDVELVKRVKGGDIVDDPKVKNFLFCVLQALGMQNADGSFNNDTVRSKLPSGLSDLEKDTIMTVCLSTVGSNASDKAWRVYKCYRENSRLNLSENL